MGDYWIFIPGLTAALLFGWVSFKDVADWKRPTRCDNCGLRPKWAFDFTSRNKSEIMRDHQKLCYA